MTRRHLLLVALALPLVALAAAGVVAFWPGDESPLLQEPVAPITPDLAVSPLVELKATEGSTGERYLRFTAAIGNMGEGAFTVHATRADDSSPWRVTQRFAERDGSTSELVTPGTLAWGGHGHDHWHIRVGASYRLTRPGSEEILRAYEKVGYCFFDQTRLLDGRTDVPEVPRYSKVTCDGESADDLEMGLSAGWSDPYQWTLPDQRLRITDLEDGVYRLHAVADPDGWFRESNEENNETWVDLGLETTGELPKVTVVREGPAGAPPFRVEG